MIQEFNKFARIICTEVVIQMSLKKRVRVIINYIKVGSIIQLLYLI